MAHILEDDFIIFSDVLLLLRDGVDIVDNHNVLLVDHVQVQHQVRACDCALVVDGRNKPMVLPKLLLSYESLIGA